jgi:hypothetical protein
MATGNFLIDYGIKPQMQSFGLTSTEQKIQDLVKQQNNQFINQNQPKKLTKQDLFDDMNKLKAS